MNFANNKVVIVFMYISLDIFINYAEKKDMVFTGNKKLVVFCILSMYIFVRDKFRTENQRDSFENFDRFTTNLVD